MVSGGTHHQQALLVKITENSFGLRARNHRRQSRRVGLPDRLHTAEVFQQAPGSKCAHSRDVPQLGRPVAHLAAFAVKGKRKTMGFVTDHLYQVQYR